jgi:hypothetical protein
VGPKGSLTNSYCSPCILSSDVPFHYLNHFNIILPSSRVVSKRCFSFFLMETLYTFIWFPKPTAQPPYATLFNIITLLICGIRILMMKLLIVHFCPYSYHVLPFRCNYSPQFLTPPAYFFFNLCQRKCNFDTPCLTVSFA